MPPAPSPPHVDAVAPEMMPILMAPAPVFGPDREVMVPHGPRASFTPSVFSGGVIRRIGREDNVEAVFFG